MIYVDITELYHFNLTTGIQRVVRKIGRELYGQGKFNDVEFVVSVGSQAYALSKECVENLLESRNLGAVSSPLTKRTWIDFIKSILKASPTIYRYIQSKYVQRHLSSQVLGERSNDITRKVDFKGNDKYLILDSFWAGSTAHRVAKACQKNKIEVFLVLYDIIPVSHSNLFFPAFSANFRFYLNKVLGHCSKILTISEASKDEITKYFPQVSSENIQVFPLGSDFSDNVQPTSKVRFENHFLSVGTIEPRKGISVTLDAFDLLWTQGCDVKLILIGRKGWRVDNLVERITTHNEYGHRLIWLDNASDKTLTENYGSCNSVIISSIVEGYGLPIIEGLSHGSNVIASNIPVFIEVGKDNIEYYESNDPASLAIKVKSALEKKPRNDISYSPTSWSEAAKVFAKIIGLDRVN